MGSGKKRRFGGEPDTAMRSDAVSLEVVLLLLLVVSTDSTANRRLVVDEVSTSSGTNRRGGGEDSDMLPMVEVYIEIQQPVATLDFSQR
jgi:hypothetical protein